MKMDITYEQYESLVLNEVRNKLNDDFCISCARFLGRKKIRVSNIKNDFSCYLGFDLHEEYKKETQLEILMESALSQIQDVWTKKMFKW